MLGILQDFKLSHGSFGGQRTTIEGVDYLTWFDLADRDLKGLEPGAEVEFEVRPGPTVLCHVPRVTSPLATARLVRVIKRVAEGA